MEKLSYKLDVFEGPLDLLLFLISKNKLNIYDIRISDLVDQYMEQIETMRENEMEIASEFLEMAARLVQIKSLSLLPKHEEADALVRELTGQLIEYQEMKKVAAMLSVQVCFDRFVRQTMEIEFEYHYAHTHTTEELYRAYLEAVGKEKKQKEAPDANVFSPIVSRTAYVSVPSRIIHLLRSLYGGAVLRYRSLFKGETRSGMVATFLALLELIHAKRVTVSGTGDKMKIKLMDGEKSGRQRSDRRG